MTCNKAKSFYDIESKSKYGKSSIIMSSYI